MQRSSATHDRRAAIAFVVLVLVVAAASIGLTRLGGGGEERQPRAATTPKTTEPAPPPPPPTTTPPPIDYVVQRGDNLTSISRQFRVTIDTIVTANQITDLDNLAEGSTLSIPPAPPLELQISPAATNPGRTIELTLTGARPSETITFEIESPNRSFTGPPHTASADGTVATTFRVDLDAPVGPYTVTARGGQDTTAESTFTVELAIP
jgi:LysM repeat protein